MAPDNPFLLALDSLRQQRDRLARELRRIDRLIADLEIQAHIAAADQAATPAPPAVEQAPPVPIKPRELALMSYAQAARVILRRAGRAMTTRELQELLEAGGKPVQGRDPYRILYRTLMKHSAFANVEKKWALVEWSKKDEENLLKGA